ncbi:MAG TPA: hypothetical protein VLB29_12300 [Nocardioidaceae bacterium]|nr:hypothetical protein [Nocardioidaceae bacterium]
MGDIEVIGRIVLRQPAVLITLGVAILVLVPVTTAIARSTPFGFGTTAGFGPWHALVRDLADQVRPRETTGPTCRPVAHSFL